MAKTQIGQGLELDRQRVSLVELTRKVVEDQRRTTNKHHIQLFVESPELTGFWDATRLERVVTNLVSNAFKYSPDGGEIEVTISQEKRDGEDIAVVRVRDHGLGIPTAEIPRIFDRFYRASNARSKVGGIGVGLASAKQIVEQHGGTIEVESEEGLGSTFTIKLPTRYDLRCIDAEKTNRAP